LTFPNRIFAFNAGLLATFFVFSYSVYEELPDVIPMHFNASGAADRFAPKSVLTWMLLPIVTLLLTALITVINAAIAKRPNSINIPNKELYRTLPPEAQKPIMDILVGFMRLINSFLIMLMFSLQILIYRGVSDGSNALPSWFIFVAFAFGLLVLGSSIVMTIMLQKAVERASMRHFADGIIGRDKCKKKDGRNAF